MLSKKSEYRRYLVEVDTISTQQLFTDCLVVGAGIAGLRAGLEAAESCNVTIVCKSSLHDSNTWMAQGGIASVLGDDDSFQSHIDDTVSAGCGVCDGDVVDQVVRQGPGLVRQLVEWGTEFDRVDGSLDVTLEGGHSHPRVAHAHGDSTGRGIIDALVRKVRQKGNINVIENFFTIDILTDDENNCIGVTGWRKEVGFEVIRAGSTILATGGAGRLYRETTNPAVATADGLAMGYRAGVVLRDLEFMQFHPTTLYIAGASRALITETIRGEGALLLDSNHERFMGEYHESGELAPRDIVSRAIQDRMRKTGATNVYLDLRHFDKKHFSKRFPLISELCESFDIDISVDLVPVRPSAHYMIGGIATDDLAQTNIENLYACGEVAATGLHGANRLGSNSLLEGLVFGKIAGEQAVSGLNGRGNHLRYIKIKYEIPQSDRSRLNAGDVRNSLCSLMWRNVGITRQGQRLGEAEEIIRFWQQYVMDKVFDGPFGWECQNMLTVAQLMVEAAQARKESRGVHFRSDYPETDEGFARHIELVRE